MTVFSASYQSHTHVVVPKGTDATDASAFALLSESHSARSRVEVQKGDVVLCLGNGQFHRLDEEVAARFPYKLLLLKKRMSEHEKDIKLASEKDAQVLVVGSSGGQELIRRGPRTLSLLPDHSVPYDAVNVADHTLETVGQIVKFPWDDNQLVY